MGLRDEVFNLKRRMVYRALVIIYSICLNTASAYVRKTCIVNGSFFIAIFFENVASKMNWHQIMNNIALELIN